jgi:ribosomal protein S14
MRVTEAVSVTKARIRIGAPQCGQTRGNTSSILASRIAYREVAHDRCTVAAVRSSVLGVERPAGRHGVASGGAGAAVLAAIAVTGARPGTWGARPPG